MGEFELIRQFFTAKRYSSSVHLGVGDDAAIVSVRPGFDLVTAVDTSVAGVHFPLDTAAYNIGWRVLAVNLSDLAAMGAIPKWFTLSLCMPEADPGWLTEFARGLHDLARQNAVELIGGDTVRGPLNISVTILGEVESGQGLQRGTASPGDLLYVSGALGEAAGGLTLWQSQDERRSTLHADYLLQRFFRPIPRVALGRGVLEHATACMDVSDGLLADLTKLCAASHVGARVDADSLPAAPALSALLGSQAALRHMLTGGDDYELLFTIKPEQTPLVAQLAITTQTPCTQIGVITDEPSVRVRHQGAWLNLETTGYDHFHK